METFVVVCLGVIALAAILQAGCLFGVAFGARKVATRVDEVAKGYDQNLGPMVKKLVDATERAATISATLTDHAHALDSRMDSATRHATFALDEAARRVESATAQAAGRFEARLEEEASRPLEMMADRFPPLRTALDLWTTARAARAAWADPES